MNSITELRHHVAKSPSKPIGKQAASKIIIFFITAIVNFLTVSLISETLVFSASGRQSIRVCCKTLQCLVLQKVWNPLVGNAAKEWQIAILGLPSMDLP